MAARQHFSWWLLDTTCDSSWPLASVEAEQAGLVRIAQAPNGSQFIELTVRPSLSFFRNPRWGIEVLFSYLRPKARRRGGVKCCLYCREFSLSLSIDAPCSGILFLTTHHSRAVGACRRSLSERKACPAPSLRAVLSRPRSVHASLNEQFRGSVVCPSTCGEASSTRTESVAYIVPQLHEAAASGNIDSLKWLLSKGVPVRLVLFPSALVVIVCVCVCVCLSV